MERCFCSILTTHKHYKCPLLLLHSYKEKRGLFALTLFINPYPSNSVKNPGNVETGYAMFAKCSFIVGLKMEFVLMFI